MLYPLLTIPSSTHRLVPYLLSLHQSPIIHHVFVLETPQGVRPERTEEK